MPAAAPAPSKSKSASLPLLALRLKSPDLDALAGELAAQYGEMPDFFENDGVVLDLSALEAEHAGAEIDFQRLGELLHERRLRLLAGSAAQHEAATALGLLLAPDARVQAAAPANRPGAAAGRAARARRAGGRAAAALCQQVYAAGATW